MSFRDVLADIKADIDRYPVRKARSHILSFIANPGAQATTVYRLGHWCYQQTESSTLWRPIVRAVFHVLARINQILTGIDVAYHANVGSGLKIPHFGGVIVGAYVSIGRNCTVSHGVTIGFGGRGDKRGAPTIGNRVFIAPGAKIFGAITIGDDVAVGANAVVTKSIPDRAVVGGIPAQIISYKGSFELIEYLNMEDDEDRKQSLAMRDSAEDASRLANDQPAPVDVTDDQF